jgi:hypothetical protein
MAGYGAFLRVGAELGRKDGEFARIKAWSCCVRREVRALDVSGVEYAGLLFALERRL